ncbi:cytochrome P450 ClCP1 [Lophiostoma macrostomum CBS 122681]|uniref:Cytochrome P450 ClCP1 n=1 Tax=Lophiostoma macrostomum CBS 122681 TaxID=1314788 RepID=A0A6A6TLU9_9PLEO|nr:cytochrome P450 ClCP1 [Lophiostoma macrostomum CBS 122681]
MNKVSKGTFAIGLALALGLYLVARALYNLFFHPLKSHPGPILWKISRVPLLFNMMLGILPYRVKEFHDRYGPVVRVAPDELSFLDGWKDIYALRYLDRPPQWRLVLPGINADDLISAVSSTHARFRKALAAAFSPQAVKKQEPTIVAYIDLLMDKLRALSLQGTRDEPAVINLVEWISYAAFDLTSDLGWGRPLQCLENGKYQTWMIAITQYQASLVAVVLKYYPPLHRLVDYITPNHILEALHTIMSIARGHVNHRLALKEKRMDIIGSILAHNKTSKDRELSYAEMLSNSTLLVLGGSGPTMTAMTGTLHYMLARPICLDRACVEVRSAFASDSEITGATTETLLYLDAVIKEGLRMCPPFPDSLRRVVRKDGAEIAGTYVPEGTVVSCAPWSTMQSAIIFNEPQQFLPERWIETHDERFSSDCRDSYYPFSLGPRNCPGQHLAMLEMRILLAKLLFLFDLKLAKGKNLRDWADQKIFWHWQQDDINVELRLKDS